MKALNGVALILVIVGALNWGWVAIGEFDLVAELFGRGVRNDERGDANRLRPRRSRRGLSGRHAAAGVLRSDDRVAFGRRDPQSAR